MSLWPLLCCFCGCSALFVWLCWCVCVCVCVTTIAALPFWPADFFLSNIFGDCCRFWRSHFVLDPRPLWGNFVYRPSLWHSTRIESLAFFAGIAFFRPAPFCHYPGAAKNHILCAICFPRFLFAPQAVVCWCVCAGVLECVCWPVVSVCARVFLSMPSM